MTLKYAPHESCDLSFIWGKMKTITQGIAFHIALRQCSKEIGKKDSIYVILVKGEYMQSRIHFLIESSSWSHETSASQEKKIITIVTQHNCCKYWAPVSKYLLLVLCQAFFQRLIMKRKAGGLLQIQC